MRDQKKNFKRFFACAQNDINTYPRPTGEGLRERGLSAYDEILRENRTFFTKSEILEKVVKRVQGDKIESEAHSKHLVPYCLSNLVSSKKVAFTLAEILIILGIIGIVAALTIPTLISVMSDFVYKNAYKAAFSDANQAFKMLQADGTSLQKIVFIKDEEGNPKPGYSPNYAENFKILAKYFKATKTCFDREYGDICWKCKDAEQAYINYADENFKGTTECRGEYSFIDAQGRNWKMYSSNESLFLVDTNGFKDPNQLGKDRFVFAMSANNSSQYSDSVPEMVKPGLDYDMTTKQRWCPSGKCYYISWLFGRSRF